MMELNSSQRRALRARAHSLHPVASISQNGLSEAVLSEIECGLKAHELIKVRVYGAERAEREALLAEVCARLQAAPVQHIGNILVLFRENPEIEKPAAPLPRKSGTAATPPRKSRTAATPSKPRRRLQK